MEKYRFYSDRSEREIARALGRDFPLNFKRISLSTAIEAQQWYDMERIPKSVAVTFFNQNEETEQVAQVAERFYGSKFYLMVANGRKVFENKGKKRQRIDGVMVYE